MSVVACAPPTVKRCHSPRDGALLVALKALVGHASLVSTEVCLEVQTNDLAHMVQEGATRGGGQESVE